MTNVVRAGLVAAVLSGLPSTVHALVTGGDVLASTRAAGSLVSRPNILAGAAVHVAVSAAWTVVLAGINRRRRLGLLGGAAAGLVIAALDLEIVGRHTPALGKLPRIPQWLDHAAFGAIVGKLL